MLTDSPILVLMGFKHVGKTVIGQHLAHTLQQRCIDLDQHVEWLYAEKYTAALNCREIMGQQGKDFFKALEHQALQEVLALKPAVIALGGSTPLWIENQRLLAKTWCVHILAPPKVVFTRIMALNPTFLSGESDPWHVFMHLWQAREGVYRHLANYSVDNNTSITFVAAQILQAFKDANE